MGKILYKHPLASLNVSKSKTFDSVMRLCAFYVCRPEYISGLQTFSTIT